MDADASKPIPAWLRASRESQTMDDGAGGQRPWTYKRLLERMKAEIDWAPQHPNYSGYETGKATPKPATLAKFVRFWKRYGIEGPDLTPRVVEPPVDPQMELVKAIAAQTTVLSELAAQVKALAERPPDAELPAEVAMAVALAVRDTLRAVGIGDETHQP